MEIKHASLHQIDHNQAKTIEKDVPAQGQDLSDYIKRLLGEITKNTSKRKFEFTKNATEVKGALQSFMEEDYDAPSRTIGNRLLRIEKEAQRDTNLPIEIQKGSLFQASIVDDDGNQRIIISKADHDEYLDTEDFLRRMGLPWKKHVYKALLVGFSSETKEIGEVFVYDTNVKISKYWWSDFLELREIYTDSHNTSRSLGILDKKVFDPIKEKYPADHTILSNASRGYFRTREEFSVKSFVDDLFRNYEPEDPKLPVEELIQKTEALPEKWNFDNRFDISQKDIDKREVETIHLDINLDLVIRDHVPNLKDIVKREMDAQGNKYIKIRTDKGYDRFPE